MRYRLRLPVIFHWNDGTEHTEGGFTSDVALDGVSILSKTAPQVGAEIRIELLLPAPDGRGEEIRIECQGHVTRMTEQQGSRFFGVRGSFSESNLTRLVLV